MIVYSHNEHRFPIGCDTSKLFCRYDIMAGPDWELVSGLSTGITQYADVGSGRFEEIVFNMPIEVMYKSTNPYGCKYNTMTWNIHYERALSFTSSVGPQITCSFYGNNWWGLETSQGYARLHVPMGGQRSRQLRAPIIIARNTNVWSAMVSSLTARNPELRNPKMLATDSRKAIRIPTESYGEVVLSLQSITRGVEKMGLDVGGTTRNSL